MVNNLLITGVPRGGTSLLTALLSGDNCLCFSEPPWLKTLKENSKDGAAVADNLRSQINTLRNRIKNGLPIEMVYKMGTKDLPDNYFKVNHHGIKKLRETRETVYPQSRSSDTFIIKANALFTANLKSLLDKPDWKIYAIIRDPLATLMSWRSVKIASSNGRVKSVEKYSQALTTIGKQSPLLKRQVLLLDWYFKQYEMLNEDQLITYENLIEKPEHYTQMISGHHKTHCIKLDTQNNNPNYNHNEKDRLIAALIKYSNHVKNHYPQYQ